MKKFLCFIALVFVFCICPTTTVKAEGFIFFDGAYYYMYDDGTFATNTQKGYFYIGPTGRLTVEDVNAQLAALASQLNAAKAAAANSYTADASDTTRGSVYGLATGILSRIITPGMTDDQKIRACFNYMIDATEYLRTPGVPSGDWTPSYAYQTLSTGKGNCYSYAASFAYLLKAAGYETRVATGQIHSIKGGLTPHGWTEICIGGNWYTIDVEMQDAKKNKYNFYIIPFDKYPIQPLIAEAYWPIIY